MPRLSELLYLAPSTIFSQISPCNPKDFAPFFILTKGQFLGLRMDPEEIALDLLTDRNAERARNMMLAWDERRNSSWADAARDAEARAASDGHLPQIRGQLRYHLGEAALAQAARSAGAGAIPLKTQPPGGVFTVARVGRFALVSATVQKPKAFPRATMSKKLLSQPNSALDPQTTLFDDKPKPVTDLAYFGCLITVAAMRDPSSPAELALAIPTPSLNRWIAWIPLHRLHAMLQERVDRGAGSRAGEDSVPDVSWPTFKIPGDKKGFGEDEPS
ncbi:hypothetical protein KMZ29_07370 [Bradyrhizobium sediminis]|uniref:Uncharacterized protein n=1 Tax=Bradyrhizobium sediminis TaxID=2840469 RepID=A0A975NGM2_9BRAD|nr:hypothetical protein [Bradyrhizobium sediminis]QWG14480.1 hypothetical protein KMZ29_07370 [Bradyrhizobium sediminis]